MKLFILLMIIIGFLILSQALAAAGKKAKAKLQRRESLELRIVQEKELERQRYYRIRQEKNLDLMARLEAIKAGDLDINDEDIDGVTALILAAELGHKCHVKFLLRNRALANHIL